MKKTFLLFCLCLLSFITNANITIDTLPKDSIKLAYFDARVLYDYARKGYYLEKIDSINNAYIISLQLENTELRGKKKELEIIIEKDNRIIKLMQEIQLALQNDVAEGKATILEQKAIIKRLRRDKMETIITGAAVTVFLILGLITK